MSVGRPAKLFGYAGGSGFAFLQGWHTFQKTIINGLNVSDYCLRLLRKVSTVDCFVVTQF
jgi:hypothetical protein